MHFSEYTNNFDPIQIEKRIKFASNNGVNTCILTGTGEALQNTFFLRNLQKIFDKMNYPFPNVELQTTGVLLKNNKKYISNIYLLKQLQVNTISLSVSDIYNDDNNSEIIGINEKLKFKLKELISFLKENNFNIRLSINMINIYDKYSPKEILLRCKELGADQITFRLLYNSIYDKSKEAEWVRQNACKHDTIIKISEYIAGRKEIPGIGKQDDITGHGKPLYRLPFGAMVYSIMDMSVVMDDNCMSKEENEKLKYVIIRENGKLYSRWDDEGSLIF
jgi:hypothetical protein